MIIEEIYSDDELNNDIFHESQQLEQARHDNNKNFQCEDESMDEGQYTPIAARSTKSVNVIQKQQNAALKIISPQEKIAKMKIQAKSNAAKGS